MIVDYYLSILKIQLWLPSSTLDVIRAFRVKKKKVLSTTHKKNTFTLFITLHFLQDRYQWMDLCAIWVEKKMELFHLRNWIWMKICLNPFLTISLIPHTTPTSQVWINSSLTVTLASLTKFHQPLLSITHK